MWLAEREAELLPVEEYFHVVFTLPQQLAALALQNAKTIYTILFRSVAETMLTIAADPKHLGAAIGSSPSRRSSGGCKGYRHSRARLPIT